MSIKKDHRKFHHDVFLNYKAKEKQNKPDLISIHEENENIVTT